MSSPCLPRWSDCVSVPFSLVKAVFQQGHLAPHSADAISLNYSRHLIFRQCLSMRQIDIQNDCKIQCFDSFSSWLAARTEEITRYMNRAICVDGPMVMVPGNSNHTPGCSCKWDFQANGAVDSARMTAHLSSLIELAYKQEKCDKQCAEVYLIRDAQDVRPGQSERTAIGRHASLSQPANVPNFTRCNNCNIWDKLRSLHLKQFKGNICRMSGFCRLGVSCLMNSLIYPQTNVPIKPLRRLKHRLTSHTHCIQFQWQL